MPWFRVDAGWWHSCGEEFERYLVKARNEKHAKEKVSAVHVNHSHRKVAYEIEPMGESNVFSDTLLMEGSHYWER